MNLQRYSLYRTDGKVREQGRAWSQYVSVEPGWEGGETLASAGAGLWQLPENGWPLGAPRIYTMRQTSDRYGYDALGRRVWVATTSDNAPCTAWPGGPPLDLDFRCDNTVRRAVWDGDQLLWETRYPDAQQESGLDQRNVTAMQ